MIIAINGRIFPTIPHELRGIDTAAFLHRLLSAQGSLEPPVQEETFEGNVVPLRRKDD